MYLKKKSIDIRLIDKMADLTVKCSCGYSIIMPVYVDAYICNYCGNKVMNNTREHFMYKIRKETNNKHES